MWGNGGLPRRTPFWDLGGRTVALRGESWETSQLGRSCSVPVPPTPASLTQLALGQHGLNCTGPLMCRFSTNMDGGTTQSTVGRIRRQRIASRLSGYTQVFNGEGVSTPPCTVLEGQLYVASPWNAGQCEQTSLLTEGRTCGPPHQPESCEVERRDRTGDGPGSLQVRAPQGPVGPTCCTAHGSGGLVLLVRTQTTIPTISH